MYVCPASRQVANWWQDCGKLFAAALTDDSSQSLMSAAQQLNGCKKGTIYQKMTSAALRDQQAFAKCYMKYK